MEAAEESQSADRAGAARSPRRAPLPARARSARVSVRVTPDELARLAARADAVGTSVAGLLLECGLAVAAGDRIASRREEASELLRLRRLIANIAGNVNQIAAKANAGGGIDDGRLAGVLGAARSAVERVSAAADRVVAGL